LKTDQTAFQSTLSKGLTVKLKLTAGTTMWISGKFDQVINGQPEDNKSTGVYSYMKMDQTEKGDYALQMACYK